MCLFILKTIAAISSGSLAIIASAVDSLLDILSGSALYLLSRAVTKRDPYNYPVSKARLEPLGIMMFACIMGMTSLLIWQDAVQSLIHGITDEPDRIEVGFFALSILAITVVVKLCLYLFCRSLSSQSSVCEALAQDHLNDTLTNSLALLSAGVASYFDEAWFMDAIGAIILSTYIIITWVHAGKEQIAHLVGKSASPAVLGQLVYLAAHHDSRILRVDKVLAYHFGPRYICEIDIVLPETMALRDTHDIGESLEIRIESLQIVERAFVHIDYEFTHKAEHKVVL